MGPDRFWGMTLTEFLLALEGFQDGQDWFRYQAAWVVSHLLAPHIAKGKEVPSPHKLLGWEEPEPEAPADLSVAAAAFEALLFGESEEEARKRALAVKFEALKQKLAAQGQPLQEGGEGT